jgi:type I restriction enzyme S subunit
MNVFFESNMMRLKLDEEIVLPRYVKYYLSSPLGYGELRKNAKQAVNQASINQTDVGQVVVPLPSLSEQRKIVNHIESLFAIADRIEAKMETLNSQIEDLPQAILAKAFRGDL